MNIWKILQDKLVQYKLEIVGGGTEQVFFEKMAHSMCLKRITFHGFTNPTEYYKRAPILCMTSNYEGFPMVLVEAMQYGCVPFAFDSFPSLYDIIMMVSMGSLFPLSMKIVMQKSHVILVSTYRENVNNISKCN